MFYTDVNQLNVKANKEIISDCVSEIEPFIDRVKPNQNIEVDFTNDTEVISTIDNYINNLEII